MQGVDLFELSAKLSHKVTEWTPLYVKVTKVIDKHTFETAASRTPIHANNFWTDDLDHNILSPEEKERCHLQFHRSTACNSHVLAFIQALKQLCDSGIPVSYEGQDVVDIWAMNTTAFDVSDVSETRILTLRDPISGVSIPAWSTYENMDVLRFIGSDVCRRFGYGVPERNPVDDMRRKLYPKVSKTTVPHWWVAVIVEGPRDGIPERRMVHIDICGAAYDDNGFLRHDESLVSLQIFTTPEYMISPWKSTPKSIVEQDLSHKFIMEPYLGVSYGSSNTRQGSLQPFSIRHLRCFHGKVGTAVEVTPVATFINRRKDCISINPKDWSESVAEMHHDIVLRSPPGTGVVICNLEKRPELNGRKGYVHECVINEPPTDRVPVWVEGVGSPLRIRTKCLRLTTRKQYASFKEILKRVEKLNKTLEAEVPHIKLVSKKDKAAFRKAVARDPEMSQALESWAGKMTISYFADPKFVRGIRKVQSPPFDGLFHAPAITSLRDGLEVADHPKSIEAFKIIKLLKAGKQRALEQNPAILHGDGTVAMEEGSDLFQLMSKIRQRIRSDQGLSEVFDMMDRKGFFPNPVGQQLG